MKLTGLDGWRYAVMIIFLTAVILVGVDYSSDVIAGTQVYSKQRGTGRYPEYARERSSYVNGSVIFRKASCICT
jgi:hypothetical protein